MYQGIQLGRVARIEPRITLHTLQPATKLPAMTPDQNASDAIDLMRRHDSDYIPVMEGDRLIGVLTKEDLAKWLSLRADRDQRDLFVGSSEPHRSR